MISGIKQICYSKYQLTPKAVLNAKSQNKPRCGALLRIDFENHGVGYADCYPWEELGDLALDEQLSLLAQDKLTPLTQKSLCFAKIDAQHRTQNKSVFSNNSLLKNHFITPYETLSLDEILKIKSLGFEFLKIKCGKNLEAEICFIKNNYLVLKDNKIKLRLDFNSSLSKDNAIIFFTQIKEQLDIIDFIEDPCEFIPKDWEQIQNDFKVSLALDRKTQENIETISKSSNEILNSFRVIIIKPAMEESQHYIGQSPQQRVVFTSYMDHPLGQLCALYEAQLFYERFPEKKEICGFLTQQLFEPNAYSEQLRIEDTVLVSKLGPGFGFDEQLKNEKWNSIKEC